MHRLNTVGSFVLGTGVGALVEAVGNRVGWLVGRGVGALVGMLVGVHAHPKQLWPCSWSHSHVYLSENRRGLRDKELISNSKALRSDLRS